MKGITVSTTSSPIRASLVALLLVVHLMSYAQAYSAFAESDRCQQIRAKEHAVRVTEGCTSPVGFCVEGVISGGGSINGKTKATILGLAPSVGLPGMEPETTLSVVGDRTIETPHGTLTLRFTAVFDTARGEFAELLRVTDGKGEFLGATGTLYLTGRLSADGISIEGDFTGVICRAGSAAE